LSTTQALALPASVSEPINISGVGWEDVQGLPCQLTAELPVAQFTVADLLGLEVGSLIDSRASSRDNVPVRANGSMIGWASFEVSENRFCVRLTELA
jgi:flagellar motor switch/type III secretory pathway protein FliN